MRISSFATNAGKFSDFNITPHRFDENKSLTGFVPLCDPHYIFLSQLLIFHCLSYLSVYVFPTSPLSSFFYLFYPSYNLFSCIFSITYRESGASTATVLTAEQKSDPTWIIEKWVLLWANQLRRWRLGLVIARLEEGHIGDFSYGCLLLSFH